MHPRRLRWIVAIVLITLLPMADSGLVTGAGFDTYREFALRTSAAAVVERAQGARPSDVKTVHSRPALLQEFAWRPSPVSAGEGVTRDSVARITFSFIDDQLFKIAVNYDGSRTQGLTAADLVTSLSDVYGPRTTARPAPSPRAEFDSLDTQKTIAEWRQGDTAVTLTYSDYIDEYTLIVTSSALDAAARKASTAAVALDVREAPAREAARAKDAADAAKAAAERTRTTNKAAFQP